MVIFPLIVNEFIQTKPVYAMHIKSKHNAEPHFGKFGRIQLDAPENDILIDMIASHGLVNFCIFTDFASHWVMNMPPALAAVQGDVADHYQSVKKKLQDVSYTLLSLPYVVETFTTYSYFNDDKV